MSRSLYYFRVGSSSASAASACLVCFQSCLGVRGVRAAFMEACRHCEFCTSYYILCAECGPLAGWLACSSPLLHLRPRPALDTRRVYKFLHYDACIYLSQHTHGVLLHALARLLYSDAHKLREPHWCTQTLLEFVKKYHAKFMQAHLRNHLWESLRSAMENITFLGNEMHVSLIKHTILMMEN
jgi:hypothetical protein